MITSVFNNSKMSSKPTTLDTINYACQFGRYESNPSQTVDCYNCDKKDLCAYIGTPHCRLCLACVEKIKSKNRPLTAPKSNVASRRMCDYC